MIREIGEELSRKDPKAEPANSKFQPCQYVRIRIPKEGENPGSPVPPQSVLGMTGVVEMEGRVYVAESEESAHMEQAYFIRIEGVGPVLAGEGWIEDT